MIPLPTLPRLIPAEMAEIQSPSTTETAKAAMWRPVIMPFRVLNKTVPTAGLMTKTAIETMKAARFKRLPQKAPRMVRVSCKDRKRALPAVFCGLEITELRMERSAVTLPCQAFKKPCFLMVRDSFSLSLPMPGSI